MSHVHVDVIISSLLDNALCVIRHTYAWQTYARVESCVWVGRSNYVSVIEWSKVIIEWYSITQLETLVGGYFRMLRDVASWQNIDNQNEKQSANDVCIDAQSC